MAGNVQNVLLRAVTEGCCEADTKYAGVALFRKDRSLRGGAASGVVSVLFLTAETARVWFCYGAAVQSRHTTYHLAAYEPEEVEACTLPVGCKGYTTVHIQLECEWLEIAQTAAVR